LLLQRGPVASFEASVTGAAVGRAPRASSRAHTDGLVAQVGAGAVLRATGDAGCAWTTSVGALCFLAAARRSHTAGLLEQAGAAWLSVGSSATKAPMASAGSNAHVRRALTRETEFFLPHENIEFMTALSKLDEKSPGYGRRPGPARHPHRLTPAAAV
jgi:hypothetical protein